jgi:muramoyltetrapeptide carboxypeptidase
MSRFERSLRQLERIGVFDQICGLMLGKPEDPTDEGAPFDRDDLLKEILGRRLGDFPVMSEVDCGHTVPMITIPQEVRVRASTIRDRPSLEFLEPAVAKR